MKYLAGILLGLLFTFFTEDSNEKNLPSTDQHLITKTTSDMRLGAFSVSLSVKDLAASKTFYESLGFTAFHGSMEMNYFIMKNEETLIGIFHGMFENNILTFNPGWNQSAGETETFDDIRKIQKELKGHGIKMDTEIAEGTSGPASFSITDPDGNMILIDQHR